LQHDLAVAERPDLRARYEREPPADAHDEAGDGRVLAAVPTGNDVSDRADLSTGRIADGPSDETRDRHQRLGHGATRQ
jgi:hypothetical protein